MKIEEVARAAKLQENIIRFYESKGLISPAIKRQNRKTKHEYSSEDVKALQQIVILRKARFSLDEIRTMQTNPEKIGEIVQAQSNRVASEVKELRQIGDAEHYSGASDWNELSRMVETTLQHDRKYTSTFHFGADDRETEEEKQAAIANFRERPPLITKNRVIVFLSILCAVFIGLTVFLAVKIRHTIPASAGATEGWVYYKVDGGLMRSRADGSEASMIFERENYADALQFVVGEDKVYISHAGSLYSVNADGSGRYQYSPEYYTSYAAFDQEYSAPSSMFFYKDSLIIYEYTGGLYGGGGGALVRVHLDGSGEEKLIGDGAYRTFSAQIWDDKLYFLGIYAQRTVEDEDYESYESGDFAYEEEPELIVYNLLTNTVESREEWLCYRDFGTVYNLTPIFNDETGMYLRNFDETTAETADLGDNLVRITPECSEGEVIAQFPGSSIVACNGDYCIYQEIVNNGSPPYILRNLETGAETEIPSENVLGFTFTENALYLSQGNYDQLEAVAYP